MSDPRRMAGAIWGRHCLSGSIAEGGMAAVFEARHIDLGKRVAIKIMHPQHASDPALVQRFVDEARAASRLQHPNVIGVHDVGIEQGTPYMVMDLLEGEDLFALLAREQRLEVERACDLMLGVVSAVSTAHADDLLHRDLKPENVFITRTRGGSEHPVLLDFGISKPMRGGSLRAMTAVGTLIGTPDYMAPEQLDAAAALDGRCDQYALGVLLYLCVTGAHPFQGQSIPQVFAAVLAGRARRPSEHVSGLPEGFEEVVLRAMHVDREQRFPSVRALGRALWPFASERVRAIWSEEFGQLTAPRRPSHAPTTPRPWMGTRCEEVRLSPSELRLFSTFEGLEDDALLAALNRGRALRYETGSAIVEQGSQGGGCFLLVDGEVEVVRSSGGTRSVLGKLPKGAVFGEIAVIDHLPRAASVVATQPTTVLYIDREGIDGLVVDDGELALRLREHVVISGIRQLRRATRRLALLLEQGSADDPESRRALEYVQAASREWALPLPDGA